jgi:hypothetical protein
VSDEMVEIYNTQCSDIDSCSQHWKNRGRAGVLTLSQLNSSSIESAIYSKIFLPAANVSNVMGIFFATVGNRCFGLFLERKKGLFLRRMCSAPSSLSLLLRAIVELISNSRSTTFDIHERHRD